MTSHQPRERADVLACTDWVADHLEDPDLVLLEVDDQPALYHRGHIPGAHLLGWRTDLQDPVRRDIPTTDALTALWTRLGITSRSRVVFYGDLHNWLAAYGYWLFRVAGLTNLSLLDGGRQHWIERGRALTTTKPQPHRKQATDLTAGLRPAFLADRAAVVNSARARTLIDVRTPQEYTGEWLTEPEYPGEAAHRPGHVPGAINLPWDEVINDDGLMKPSDELRRLVTAADLSTDDPPLVLYCRIGERSAHTWIVLHEILGHHQVANYNGSWTEWGSMTGMPIQLGSEPGRFPND